MASTIKVDNIQDQCGSAVVTKCGASKTLTVTTAKANNYQAADGGNIINQCGTTITLGASGDTIQLACGATQSGFSRTGTVDWDTTAKTAGFTAVSGTGYFVNTTSGAITVTLPATPSAGDIVSIADYAGTAATNNITIARNGSNIEGGTADATLDTNREARTYVYVDGTQGWVPVNTNDSASTPPAFVTATGGTITTCGDYKTHVFTGPGTFCVSCAGNPVGSNTVDYFVVAGGGAGSRTGGGGGGGGFRLSQSTYCSASPLATPTALPVSIQGYPITVGAGGAAQNLDQIVNNPGSNSVFSTITSAGGGGAASYSSGPGPGIGANGGSGGGGATADGTIPGGGLGGGTGNTPPVSPPQGQPGGAGTPTRGGGGGGGAGAAGGNSPGTNVGGTGGDGTFIPTSALGPAAPGVGEVGPAGRYFSGGGGGSQPSGTAAGGLGGGGDGGNNPNPAGAGAANTGGAGAGTNNSGNGTGGGSGIVIIRYKYQ
jgi:hypothetical protein